MKTKESDCGVLQPLPVDQLIQDQLIDAQKALDRLQACRDERVADWAQRLSNDLSIHRD